MTIIPTSSKAIWMATKKWAMILLAYASVSLSNTIFWIQDTWDGIVVFCNERKSNRLHWERFWINIFRIFRLCWKDLERRDLSLVSNQKQS